jgi:hypothetical protein
LRGAVTLKRQRRVVITKKMVRANGLHSCKPGTPSVPKTEMNQATAMLP